MTEGKLLGVCAWLSDKFELDVTVFEYCFCCDFFFRLWISYYSLFNTSLALLTKKENKYVVSTEKQLEAMVKVRDKNITENDTIENEKHHNR